MQQHPHDGIRELRFGTKTYYLLGTAHVSAESVRQAREAVSSLRPDRVCVELDPARHKSIEEGNSWKQLDIFRVIREKRAFLMLGNLVLTSFQRRLGADVGTKPGAEMIAALEAAAESEVPFSLVDRDIQVTLRRAWALSGFFGRMKLLSALLGSVFTREELSVDDIESLKKENELGRMMQEMADFLPSVKHVLIDERDEYLATNLFLVEENRVLAVVGAGHLDGIVAHLSALHGSNPGPVEKGGASASNPGSDVDSVSSTSPVDNPRLAAPPQGSRPDPSVRVAELGVVPPKGIVGKVLPWLIPIAVLALIVWGFFRNGFDGGMRGILRWFVVNGSLSAIGCILALAHPLTILVSALAAPFTSMNPTIGVGFVAGLLEAVLRKPRVQDMEQLQDDVTTIRGFYRNRLTHALVVFLLSSVGSAIGTFVAIPLLFPAG